MNMENKAKAKSRPANGVGQILQAARQEKGLLLEEVSEEIKIREHFLNALENEKWDDLPGQVYIIGFVRTYGAFLGLDVEDLVKKVRRKNIGEETLNVLPTPYEEEGAMPSKGLLWVLVILILGAVAWWGYFISLKPVKGESLAVQEEVSQMSDAEMDSLEPAAGKLEMASENVTEPAVDSLALEEVSVEDEMPAEVVEAAEEVVQELVEELEFGPDGERLMFKANGEVWFQIRTTGRKGKVVLNKTLRDGDTLWIDRTDDVVADIGKPEVLDIYVDGKLQGTSSLRGGIVKGLSLKPDFLVEEYFGKNIHLPDDQQG